MLHLSYEDLKAQITKHLDPGTAKPESYLNLVFKI